MPNWCHNTLTVTGEPGELARFAEAVKEDDKQPLSFAKHVPEPDYETPIDEQRGVMPDWYTWRAAHWGTKWDASFSGPMVALGAESADTEKSSSWCGVRQLDEHTLVFKFDTAWSPPTPWLQFASSMEPELEFSLASAEVGSGYAGRMKLVNGVEVESEDCELEDILEPEEMWF
jgi:hypothetical protein